MLGDSVRRRQGGRRPKTHRPSTGRPMWRRWLPAALAAAIVPFAIGWALAVFVLFPPAEAPGQGVIVPELVGRTVPDAQRELVTAMLGELESWQLPHPSRQPGTIIAQNPLPGQQLRPGARVQVAVSTGRPRGVVPDLAGFQADRAEGLLRRMGFSAHRRGEHSEAPVGRVLRLEPPPGSEHDLPAIVTLIVSEGLPEPEPDLLLPPDTLPGLPGGPGMPPGRTP
jgi:eukaryotic-like serine/threonine-protein kinase